MSTPAFMRDFLVIPVLRELRTCAAEEFALAGRMPCRFPITWGSNQPPADACDCTCEGGHGQAWIRWVSTAPADLGGSVAGSDCANGLYEFQVELGVYRCWPVPEGGPLDEGEEELAALGMLLDAAVLRRTFQCCAALEERQWELNSSEPGTNQGGCTGVTAQATITEADCACGDFSSAPQDMQRAAEILLGTKL